MANTDNDLTLKGHTVGDNYRSSRNQEGGSIYTESSDHRSKVYWQRGRKLHLIGEIATRHENDFLFLDETANEAVFYAMEPKTEVLVFRKVANKSAVAPPPVRRIAVDKNIADSLASAEIAYVENGRLYWLGFESEPVTDHPPQGGNARENEDDEYEEYDPKPAKPRIRPALYAVDIGQTGKAKVLLHVFGDRTQLDHPKAISVLKNRVYVMQDSFSMVLGFDMNSSGNVAPTQILHDQLSRRLESPRALAVDERALYVLLGSGDVSVLDKTTGAQIGMLVNAIPPVHQDYAALHEPPADMAVIGQELFIADGTTLFVFDKAATGETKPKRILTGPHTQLNAPSQITRCGSF